MRKLASIQKILSISPIEGADKIEKATVLGWECVIAKKDNFKVGDLVVYIEVDSIVPEKPEFEFLRDRKFRVRTIRLKKQVSQGLVLPLSVLPDNKKYSEDDDVTDILKIRKYDPEGDAELKLQEERLKHSKNKLEKFLAKYKWYRKILSFFNPKKEKGFPKFIKKTDEDRIQLFPNIVNTEKDTVFSVTEKVDGCSATYFLVADKNWLGKKKYRFGVCSRNLYLKNPDNSSYWTVAKQYDIENILKKIIQKNDFVAIQGEILGSNIQGNKYKIINGYKLKCFNLIYPDKKVNSEEANLILGSEGLEFVPILDNNFKLKPSISENVDYAKGKSVLADIQREGVVVRNYEKGISFKIINPEFLLKYNAD